MSSANRTQLKCTCVQRSKSATFCKDRVWHLLPHRLRAGAPPPHPRRDVDRIVPGPLCRAALRGIAT